MEWQQVIGFYHVARLGSFTKAAKATFRTQSALSQQVKSLEAELDTQLIERIAKRRFRLTPAGERFLRFSETFLSHHESLMEDLNQLKRIQTGQLKIAAPFTTLYHLFPETIKNYILRFPQVELTILDRSQESVVDLTRNGDIDFGFALESLIPKDLSLIRWIKVGKVLITPMGHPLAREKRISLRQIAKYPLILPPRTPKSGSRESLDQRFKKQGIDCRVVMESSNVELSSIYVEMGLGISFATVVRDLPLLKGRKLEFVPLDHYFKPEYIAVVMRKDKTLPPYKSAFVNTLLESSTVPAS